MTKWFLATPRLLIKAATSWVFIGLLVSATILVVRTWRQNETTVTNPSDSGTFASMIQHDPSIGTRIEADLPSSGAFRILVCTTMCGCDQEALQTIKDRREPHGVLTRLVVPATEASLSEKPGLAPFKEYFFFDPNYNLIDKLNAKWMPRVFVIDGENRLVWKSETYGELWPSLRTKALAYIEQKVRR